MSNAFLSQDLSQFHDCYPLNDRINDQRCIFYSTKFKNPRYMAKHVYKRAFVITQNNFIFFDLVAIENTVLFDKK